MRRRCRPARRDAARRLSTTKVRITNADLIRAPNSVASIKSSSASAAPSMKPDQGEHAEGRGQLILGRRAARTNRQHRQEAGGQTQSGNIAADTASARVIDRQRPSASELFRHAGARKRRHPMELASAAWIIEMAIAAPVPSPSRRSRSSIGRAPRCSRTQIPCPPSAERWEKNMRRKAGNDPVGSGSGGGGDKTVNHRGHPPRRRTQAYARHRRDFKSAQRRQQLLAVGETSAMALLRGPYNLHLAPPSGLIQTRSASRYPGGVDSGDRAQQGGRRQCCSRFPFRRFQSACCHPR